MAQLNEDTNCTALTLFGGKEGWFSADWTASDDSIRGGKSKSYLDCDENTALFRGSLDFETLGGAGFASQRTTGDDHEWDLSVYVGIKLEVAKGDKKRYTFILKDDLLPPNKENGREQSTISWECDFELPPQAEPGKTRNKSVFIPWKSFNPTYRGKLQKDADPIDLKKIKRFSIMIRSFFGTQEGDFSLCLKSISAVCKAPKPGDDVSTIILGQPFDLEHGTARTEQDRSYYNLQMDLGLFGGRVRLHRRTTNTLALLALFLASYQLVRTYVWR